MNIKDKTVRNSNLIIAYDGEALQNHSMDIKELALSLSAIGDLFDDANTLLNGNNSKTYVKVKSDFKSGSFEINLEVINKLTPFLDFFNNDIVNGALNLIQIIGFSSGSIGLIQLIKKINNKNNIEIKQIDKEKSEVIIGDNIEIVRNEVITLYKNKKTISSLYQMLSPLEKEGIESFEVREKVNNETMIIESVSKEELKYFQYQNQDIKVNEYETIMYLNLIYPNFEDGKWRVSTGEGKFFAAMKDERFLNEINTGQKRFGKKDILKVRMLVKQNETGDMQIKNEHEILEVLEHKLYDQLKLNFNKD